MHSLTVDGLDRPLRVVRFRGEEALSRPFEIDIAFVCEEHEMAQLVGREAALAIDGGELAEPRFLHGVIGRFAHADAAAVELTSGHGHTQREYRVTLVPTMSRMRLRVDSRIFQGLTAPQIIADVLARAGFANADDERRSRWGEARARRDPRAPSGYRMALGAAYRARENCVQYRESDWDFINRLMEDEGISYFFEHDASSDVLVISDAPATYGSIATETRPGEAIPYRPDSGGLGAGERVMRLSFTEEARPARVAVTDYAFERPLLPLASAAQVDAGTYASPFEVFEHPGGYDLPDAGRDVARLRLEEIQASRWTGEGESDSVRLAPGRTFSLIDHPTADLNRTYLITRAEHRWAESNGGRYGCRFGVVSADIAHRPARVTPRPIIHGIQTAIVVGPPGEEIHTDEHGRIKVRFHWDRCGFADDRCSCWMRVAQASAGAGWGSVFLPRVGHEVVVDFLDGDPDRPLVTGSVYHGANVPPYALPAARTKTTIKTSSSPGGDGSNELSFEDRKGGEEVYLHAQRDLSVKVENDKEQKVGGDESHSVSGNRTVHVSQCHTETVLLAQTVLVGGALTETVGGLMALTVGAMKTEMVGLASIEGVGMKKSTTVGLSYSAKAGTDIKMKSGASTSLTAGKNISAKAVGNVSIDAGKDMKATAGGKVSVTAGKNMSVAVTGDHADSASGKRTIVVGEELTLVCGEGKITVKKDGTITVEGNNISVKGQGAIEVEGEKLNVKSEGPVIVEASGKVQVKGGSVGIN